MPGGSLDGQGGGPLDSISANTQICSLSHMIIGCGAAFYSSAKKACLLRNCPLFEDRASPLSVSHCSSPTCQCYERSGFSSCSGGKMEKKAEGREDDRPAIRDK